jgi:hypothetical protein
MEMKLQVVQVAVVAVETADEPQEPGRDKRYEDI